MLHARHEVVPRQRVIGQIDGAGRIGVQQRGSLHPILVRGVDLHFQRTGVGLLANGVATLGLAGNRIGRRHIGIREHALRIEKVLTVARGAPRLREPIVQADAAARRNPIHHAVDDLAILAFFGIEAKRGEVVQEAPWLRRDFRVDTGDVARHRIGDPGIVLGFKSEKCHRVAESSESDSVDCGVLRDPRKIVDIVRVERLSRGQQADRSARGVISPTRRWYYDWRVIEVLANRKRRLGLIERRSRIRERVRRYRRAVHDVVVRRAGNRGSIRVLCDRQVDDGIEVGSVRPGRSVPTHKD